MKHIPITLCLAFFILTFLLNSNVLAAGSENFDMPLSTVDSSGGESGSESFDVNTSTGQSTPIGKSESENFINYAGFHTPQYATASGAGYNIPGAPLFRASLSLKVNSETLGTSWLKYYYTRNRLSLVSTSITGISANGGTATVTGIGTVNGVLGCSFTATITDSSPDAIGIVITPGGSCTTSYNAPSQAIAVGNYSVVGE
ncbi:MAG: hypothetical protein HZC11_04495 [Nitrospirae bacterium]|nr:hypothetical protein [Nitrospirota bacterium]